MANEPTGAPSPESRPEHSAEKTRKTAEPVSDASSTPRDGQTGHSTPESGPASAPADAAVKPKSSGIQIQPASDIIARSEGTAPIVADPTAAKPCPTDEEGRLVSADPTKEQTPPTTTEGTDGHTTTGHDYEEDNPYHQETTDYHHDDYHHDDPHHDEHHSDPYHYQSDDHGGSGGWVPPGASGSDADDSADKPEEEEEGGGPIKGFLDHLEDLRWMMIKCLSSVLVAMVVCLIAGDKIIDILKYPLDQAGRMSAQSMGEDQPPRLRLQLGTNEWFIPWTTNQNFGPIPLGTNAIKSMIIVPVQIGTNVMLALQPDPVPRLFEVKKKPLIVLDPMEPFTIILDIALWGGLGLASPFVFLFVGQFVMPALRKRERKWVIQSVFIGMGLFLLGVLFCYFLIMKVTYYATASFAEWMGFQAEMWQADKYISFTMKFLIGMGISFELPVVLLTLVKVGILSYERLSAIRPYMVIILMTVAGFITPSGDPFSMVLMAAPLYVLYEISIFVAWIWHRRDLREKAAEELAEREGK